MEDIKETVMQMICDEFCVYPYKVKDQKEMEKTCANCKMDVLIMNCMAAGLCKFQYDLMEFAKVNWANSCVDMLDRAIQCVMEGKKVYDKVDPDE